MNVALISLQGSAEVYEDLTLVYLSLIVTFLSLTIRMTAKIYEGLIAI